MFLIASLSAQNAQPTPMQIMLLLVGRKMIGIDIVLAAVRLIFTIFGVARDNQARINAGKQILNQ